MGRNGTKKSKKFDIYSWLPPRVTRSRAKNENLQKILDETNLINEQRSSRNSTPDRRREQDQNPDPVPNPPQILSPKTPKSPPRPTPKFPVRAANPNLKKEKRTITEILNELYTNPNFPTVTSSKILAY